MCSLIFSECMQRSEDGCDIRKFRSFKHGTRKTFLDLLEAIYLRLRKTVVDRVIVIQFGVDNRGSDGTGCFRIKVRTHTVEFLECIELAQLTNHTNIAIILDILII